MITLITGVPGGGKTLKTVDLVLKELDHGRAVYTNISGFSDSRALPAPDDWRDTPEGSLVVYDEAQKIFPSSAKVGVSDDARIRALETHRHTGHDIFFVTQDPALIHLNVRKLVGRHIHLHRAMGLRRATVYTWDFAVTSPNSRVEQKRADSNNWFYPKSLFSKYQSATKHTHKFQLPVWPTVGIVVGVLFCGIFVYSTFFRASTFSTFKHGLNALEGDQSKPLAVSESGAMRAPAANGSLSSDWRDAPTLPATKGCAVLSNSCRCWDGDGHQLDLNRAQCMNLASAPLPLDFSHLLERDAPQEPASQSASPVTTSTPHPHVIAGASGDPAQVGPPGSPMSRVGASPR